MERDISQTDEDPNIITYRQALHALWDLQAVMPAECNPAYGEWLVNWNEQQSATEMTRDDLRAVIGASGIVDIILQERKIWEANQS